MKVILFGATGMVGQSVLRECLLDPGVEEVLSIGRRTTGEKNPKLRELVHADLTDYSSLSGELAGYDACFFCIGVTSAGLSETEYRRATLDTAVASGRAVVEKNPGMTFIFVSAAGADPTGKSRTMWARVKGEAENALAAMPFAAVYCFRPAIIRPMHGITSRTFAYRALYAATAPVLPLLTSLLPGHMTTTERLGRAMLHVARHGAPRRVLGSEEINAAAAAARP